MGFPTPNSVPSDTICRTIQIPDDPLWLAIVNGALSELLDLRNYEPYGTLTPEETALAFADMFYAYLDSDCAAAADLPADLQDDFKRGDFATLGGNWSTDYINLALPPFELLNQQAVCANAYSGDWWNQATYGPNSHVFAQINSLIDGQAAAVSLGIINPHTNNASGYGASLSRTSGSYTLLLQRSDNRTPTTLSTFSGVTFADGNWLRLVNVAGLLTVQTSMDGLTWADIGSSSDSTYNTGYITLFASGGSSGNPVTIGAFGGGTLP